VLRKAKWMQRMKLEVNWKRMYIGFVLLGFGIFAYISVFPEYRINISLDPGMLGNLVYILLLGGSIMIRFAIKSKREERHGS